MGGSCGLRSWPVLTSPFDQATLFPPSAGLERPPRAICTRSPAPPSSFRPAPRLLRLHRSAQMFAAQCHLLSSGSNAQGRCSVLRFCFGVFPSCIPGRPDRESALAPCVWSLLSSPAGPVIPETKPLDSVKEMMSGALIC